MKDWHVVLKVFPEWWTCPGADLVDWHQYGVSDGAYHDEKGGSFTIAPGFWKADVAEARLPRLPRHEWCQNVRDMVDSRQDWQLVVSFNEAGEGTFIEPAKEWINTENALIPFPAKTSENGYYLDCLHDIQ